VRTFYVYILANASRTLYIGMTNDLERRMFEHKTKRVPGFTARYGIDQLVYYEQCDGPWAAIEREKALKGWLRGRKVMLIESSNPAWDDLSAGWFGSDARFQLPAGDNKAEQTGGGER
jgi:putative endonuclease